MAPEEGCSATLLNSNVGISSGAWGSSSTNARVVLGFELWYLSFFFCFAFFLFCAVLLLVRVV